MLEERFSRFSDETQKVGSERVDNVNAIADQLIGTGHSDASTIAEWKDGLNESWVNLLELLKTRKEVKLLRNIINQIITISYRRWRFFFK